MWGDGTIWKALPTSREGNSREWLDFLSLWRARQFSFGMQGALPDPTDACHMYWTRKPSQMRSLALTSQTTCGSTHGIRPQRKCGTKHNHM